MTITFHRDLIQGTPEWFAVRCGLLTSSEMKLIITPSKLQYGQNDKERGHLYELAAQRINKYVEPRYISDDMLRGKDDEIDARITYEENYAKVQEVGFITNDKFGFTLGYSPDGLVGDDGLIEVKGRRQKFQIETIVNNKMPDEYLIQVQTGLLVSERKWCDFISYCGGLPMLTLRIYPDEKVQEAIICAAGIFHEKLDKLIDAWGKRLQDATSRFAPTERRVEKEITL